MKKESAKENDWLIHILKEDIQNGKNEKKEEKNKKGNKMSVIIADIICIDICCCRC